ncbi:hypothetical protein PIB30_060831 [Stylosanthes scabra]|uniref:Uncharacterized protein n=1 Tax=Stylosanthes scabra TaxID=79078 RepID=A0ABU6SKQ6_9FABA|nr:hypothetical protein [Stylosanthes scabra]
MNVAGNANNVTMEPIQKAKKNKKKMPTPRPCVRVKPPKNRPQNDEIPISQRAPNDEEHGAASQNLGHGVQSLASNALGLQATQRMKQPIIRPQIPPITTQMANTTNSGPPLTDHVQNLYSGGPRGVLAQTLAAICSRTIARLFKYMSTLGFKPPRQK